MVYDNTKFTDHQVIRENALSLEDLSYLEEGDVFNVVHTNVGPKHSTIKLDYIFTGFVNNEITVKFKWAGYNQTKKMFVSDCGLLPYKGGKWNAVNYITVDSELQQKIQERKQK